MPLNQNISRTLGRTAIWDKCLVCDVLHRVKFLHVQGTEGRRAVQIPALSQVLSIRAARNTKNQWGGARARRHSMDCVVCYGQRCIVVSGSSAGYIPLVASPAYKVAIRRRGQSRPTDRPAGASAGDIKRGIIWPVGRGGTAISPARRGAIQIYT